MKKIACVGYHYTGSGVIDDILRECDNVAQGTSEAECRILQETDGVADLEYHLIDNPHRTGSAIAVERFLRYAKDHRRMYEKVFGKKWLPICYEYIESISKFQFQGYNFTQLYIKKPYTKYIILFHKIINKLLPSSLRKPGYYDYFPKETAYHAMPPRELFLKETKKFIEKLCLAIPNPNQAEYVVLDQLIAGNNPNRYLRYIDDIKIIVVDRDPRDLYIYHHSRHDHMLPKDPHHFCVHYKDIRQRVCQVDAEKVLYVTFEDLIYSYDIMVEKVLDFIGIPKSHHIHPRRFFNPEISIKGTQLWKTHPEYAAQVKIIEQELPDYIHQY